MTPRTTRYDLKSAAHGRAVTRSIRERFRVLGEKTTKATVTYHDTQEWSIHSVGGVLRTMREGRSLALDWCDRDESIVAHQQCSAEPGLASDLDDGPVSVLAASALGIRRALPLARLAVETRVLPVCDDEGKTVARVAIITAALVGAPKPTAPVWRIARVTPVRGYRRAFREADAFVAEITGSPCTATSLRERAFAASGRTPRDYTAKPPYKLDGTMRADTALKHVYNELLNVIVANEDGIRGDLDPEFLHDFRTAVRRTRAALSQVKGVLPKSVVERAKYEFRWLGQMTGPKRDSDVYLLKLPDYEEELPRKIRSDLAPLRDYLATHDRLEHSKLVEVLNSKRYAKWIRSWRGYLSRPDAARPGAPDARRPILEVASERIRKADRRVLRMGRAISRTTPAEALHELRIDCKKLRYLITFFKSLYPADLAKGCLSDLSDLQDNLGDFNDLEVQQDALRAFGEGMRSEGYGTADSLLAMGWLVERLARRQSKERRLFEKRFARFDTPAHHKRMARLIAYTPDAPTA